MQDDGCVFPLDAHHILTMSPHERLAAWRRSYELVLKVYESTDTFPNHERFGLTSQTRRAAFSVVANIAEGSAKKGAREFRRYLDIALGSITELQVALRLARDRAYLSAESWAELERARNRAGILTWKLYRAVQNGRREP